MACNNELRENNKPYPRTCADCKLGPCRKLGHKHVQTLQEAQAEIARLQAEVSRLTDELAASCGRAELQQREAERLRRDNGVLHDAIEKIFEEGAKQLARANTAWNDAIEAAAQAADDCRKSAFTAGMGMQPVIESIRALKRSQ